MKKHLSKVAILFLIIATAFNVYGCTREEKLQKGQKIQFETYWSYEYQSDDERLYKQLIGLTGKTDIPQKLRRSDEEVEGKYAWIGDALTWEMKKYSYDKDKEYHVILQYFDIYESPDHDGTIPQEIIDMINEKYDRNFRVEDWIKVDTGGFQYYYLFTADEIYDLSDFGIICRYVGSGEGNIEDVNFDTDEGIATFFELHGDGTIQHKDGMKIYY
ncbi:MAG: hypothetical protein ACI4EN_07600 [Butyrivibrio sp.]